MEKYVDKKKQNIYMGSIYSERLRDLDGMLIVFPGCVQIVLTANADFSIGDENLCVPK